MDNRSISPLVLAGGVVAAGLLGFVGARSLGDSAPPVPVTAASGPVVGQVGQDVLPLGASDGTEATVDPVIDAEAAPRVARAPAAAAVRSVPPAGPRNATPSGATSRGSARVQSRPAPAPARPASPPPQTQDGPIDVARNTPTWSRPFPAPEATRSLPVQTPPKIDAPPPPPQTRSVALPVDSVVGLQIESTVSSANAAVEDTVHARVTRDVLADGLVVIPAGTRVTGSVTFVDEGGKMRERARLGVRFHTLVLADGTELRLPTETVYRDGESPTGRSAAKIGGSATAGAVIGAILGGGKGAAIGAAVGAGGGTAATMAGRRLPATLPAGQTLTVRLSDPVTLDVPR